MTNIRVEVPVAMQRQAHVIQEVPQAQYIVRIVSVPVVLQRQMPTTNRTIGNTICPCDEVGSGDGTLWPTSGLPQFESLCALPMVIISIFLI